MHLSYDPILRLTRGMSDAEVGERAGFSQQVINSYRRRGMLAPIADRLASGLGYHPCELWGDRYWAAERWFEVWGTRARFCPRGLVDLDPELEVEPEGWFAGRLLNDPSEVRPPKCSEACTGEVCVTRREREGSV